MKSVLLLACTFAFCTSALAQPGQFGAFAGLPKPPTLEEQAAKAIQVADGKCDAREIEGFSAVVRCITGARRPIWKSYFPESLSTFESHHRVLLRLAIQADAERWPVERFKERERGITADFLKSYNYQHAHSRR